MKNKFSLLIVCLFFFFSSIAQEIRFGLGYDQLYAKELDRLIQTYNFTRPFLDESQPLISNGTQAQLSYIFDTQKKNWSSGVALSHSYNWSSANSTGADVRFNFNTIKLGYLLHFENDKAMKGLFFDGIISGNIGLLTKRMNQETFKVDGETLQSWHFGGQVQLNMGYKIALNRGFHISPYVGIGYAPYMTEGQAEVVINQTSTLVDQEYDAMMNWNLGLMFHFIKSSEKRSR
ncbi:MAG: hypothetical protein RLO09_20535 [Cyclobacteriaceae bacterium]